MTIHFLKYNTLQMVSSVLLCLPLGNGKGKNALLDISNFDSKTTENDAIKLLQQANELLQQITFDHTTKPKDVKKLGKCLKLALQLIDWLDENDNNTPSLVWDAFAQLRNTITDVLETIDFVSNRKNMAVLEKISQKDYSDFEVWNKN